MPLDPILLHDRETCGCVRCTGFQPGHQINKGKHLPRPDLVTHGTQVSPLVLAPAAEAIAVMVREVMPVAHPAFEGTLQSYCIILARIQRAHDALERVSREAEAAEEAGEPYQPNFNVISLGEDLRRWQGSALKHATALGLTPESAAKILKDTSEGFLASQRGLSEQQLRDASTDQLERARQALLEPDAVDG